MAGVDLGVVGQAEQPFLDAVAQRFVVASGEVGAADATTEQCIACEDPAFDFGVETDAAFGMARRADDLQRTLPHLDDFAILQVAVRQLALAVERDSEQLRMLLRALEVGFHTRMGRHFDAIFLLDGGIADDVVEMAVRVDDQNGLQAVAVDVAEELVFGSYSIAARVDDDAVA